MNIHIKYDFLGDDSKMDKLKWSWDEMMEKERPQSDYFVNLMAFRYSVDLSPDEIYAFQFSYDEIDELYHYEFYSFYELIRTWIFRTHFNNQPLYCQIEEELIDGWCSNTYNECTCKRGKCPHHKKTDVTRYQLFMTRSLEILIRCMRAGNKGTTHDLTQKLKAENHLTFEDYDFNTEISQFLKENKWTGPWNIPPRNLFLKLVDYDEEIVDRPWEAYQKNDKDVFKKLIKVINMYKHYGPSNYHRTDPPFVTATCDNCPDSNEALIMTPGIAKQYYDEGNIPPTYLLHLRHKIISAPPPFKDAINAASLMHSVDISPSKLYNDFKFRWEDIERMYHHEEGLWIFKMTWEGKPIYGQLTEEKKTFKV